MWSMIDGVTQNFRRPVRKASKASMIPALLIGAGVGIATWEVVKRRVPSMTSGSGPSASSTTTPNP